MKPADPSAGRKGEGPRAPKGSGRDLRLAPRAALLGGGAPPRRPASGRSGGSSSGPALLVSVGYMDPGNWGTDLAAGAQYRYELLWVVAAGQPDGDLHAGHRRPAGRGHRQGPGPGLPRLVPALDALAELARSARSAIAACDLAEVLGSAVALNLLFRHPALLGGDHHRHRRLRCCSRCSASACGPSRRSCCCWWPPSAVCYFIEIFVLPPDRAQLRRDRRGALAAPGLRQEGMVYLAIGIVGRDGHAAQPLPALGPGAEPATSSRTTPPSGPPSASTASTRPWRSRSRSSSTPPSWCWRPWCSTARRACRSPAGRWCLWPVRWTGSGWRT